MKHLEEVKTFRVIAGTNIEDAIREARLVCERNSCIVEFSFNGVDMEIHAFDNVKDRVAEYRRELKKEERDWFFREEEAKARARKCTSICMRHIKEFKEFDVKAAEQEIAEEFIKAME